MKIPVGVSAHHVHLTKETYKLLFGEEILPKRNDLIQTGEFASDRTVTLKNANQEITNVRILGPFRTYNQVELSVTEMYKMKINPIVRNSGDIANTPGITIVGPKGQIILEHGVIVATRHIHMDPKMATTYGISNNDIILVKIDKEKKATLECIAKVVENGVLELHLDTDDANSNLLKSGDQVETLNI